MNIDKNKITYPKQLIGGDRRDKGTIQIFTQSTDNPKIYSTGLNGVYDMKLIDIKLICALASGFSIQMISDTFRINHGNTNNNFRYIFRSGTSELTTDMVFKQVQVNDKVSISFSRNGSIGNDINLNNYNTILTFEYEKL